MEKKRMFQILDEMNVADSANDTALVQVAKNLDSAKVNKSFGTVTMRVPPELVITLLNQPGKLIPLLVVVDRSEYLKIAEQKG